MSIETRADFAGMRKVARVVKRVLDALEEALVPGISTAELDGIAADVIEGHGARSAPQLFYGFPGVTCISVNEEIVHGVPSLLRRIAPGDVVKIDVTVEKDGYVADAARTLPVMPVGPDVLRLVEGTRHAFDTAMAVIRSGRPVRDIGRAVERDARQHGLSVLDGLCGHGVGRSIHEEPTIPNVDDPGTRGDLTRGLVIAVEPMLSLGCSDIVESRDGWTILTRDGALAAHHEHTVVVTCDTPIILTA